MAIINRAHRARTPKAIFVVFETANGAKPKSVPKPERTSAKKPRPRTPLVRFPGQARFRPWPP